VAINLTDVGDKSVLQARAPDNVSWRPPQRLQGFLAPGVIIAANDTNGVVVNVMGAGRIRVIAKVSAAGTLRLRWRLADHLTDLATAASNPADPGTALVAATELVIDIPNNPGHAYLEVAVVNGAGASTVSYVDVVMNTPGN
jgi:hypothetical protein